MELTLITPPTALPVSLAEAKMQPRVDGSTEDDLITGMIASATRLAEVYMGRAICPQTWDLYLERFPCAYRYHYRYHYHPEGIDIPLSPVTQVLKVEYVDTSGNLTTIDPANYRVYLGDRASVLPLHGQSWPASLCQPHAVRVRFVAGYDAPVDPDAIGGLTASGEASVTPYVTPEPGPSSPYIPANIKAAIKLMVGHLYMNREATTPGSMTELPFGFTALLGPSCTGRYS